ncbi:hypothetical protein N7523_006875 [Penicillium sp. IBT 18751x]|nr:hypothetical protein N7523_006875 [Penicillium sp. IBT 18751x]
MAHAGVLVEPLSVARHTVSRILLQSNDAVLIVGTVLKSRDVQSIILVEISAQRRELAQVFGTSHSLKPKKVDTVAEIRALTGEDQGTSVALECSNFKLDLIP